MQKEERILFPTLIRGLPPVGLPAVAMMRLEHEDHGQALGRMVALAHGLVQPRGACKPSGQAVQEAAQEAGCGGAIA